MASHRVMFGSPSVFDVYFTLQPTGHDGQETEILRSLRGRLFTVEENEASEGFGQGKLATMILFRRPNKFFYYLV